MAILRVNSSANLGSGWSPRTPWSSTGRHRRRRSFGVAGCRSRRTRRGRWKNPERSRRKNGPSWSRISSRSFSSFFREQIKTDEEAKIIFWTKLLEKNFIFFVSAPISITTFQISNLSNQRHNNLKKTSSAAKDEAVRWIWRVCNLREH